MISNVEKESIKKDYEEYLCKLDDYDKYVDGILHDKIINIKYQEIAIYVTLYGLVNLIYSICCLTLFSNTKFSSILFNTIFVCIVFPVVPIGIHVALTAVKDFLMKNSVNYLSSQRNLLIKKYKDEIDVKYSKVIKAYDHLLDYERINKDKIELLMKKIKSMNKSQFRKTVIWLLNKNGYTVYEHSNKEVLRFIADGKKGIVFLGHSSKKILLRDIREFEKIKYEDDYDYVKIFFVNDISSVVYDYCVASKIEMCDTNYLCEEISKFKNEIKN